MKLENLKRKSILLALFGIVVMVGKMYGLYEIPTDFNNVFNLVITILTTLGVVIDDSPKVDQNQGSL